MQIVLYSIGTSPNGWTDDHLCLEWFEKSFIPQATARNTSGKPILLIYDGHGSHTNVEIARLAVENNILLVQLPPHTTHKLQPLDVGVFGPFQRAWIERCEDIVTDLGEEMPIRDFVKEYMAVRTNTFTKKTIQMAWKKSGAWPIDKAVFSDGDYAPSVPFSTTASHLPKDFDPTASFPSVVAPSWAPDSCVCEIDENDLNDTESDEDSNEEDDGDERDLPSEPGCSVVQLPASSTVPSQVEPPHLPSEPSPDCFVVRLPSPIPTADHSSPGTSSLTAPSQVGPPPTWASRPMKDVHGAEVWEYIRRLERQNDEMRAHMGMMSEELKVSKRKINIRDAAKTSKRRKLNSEHRLVNSDEGLRILDEEARKDQEKKAKKKAAAEAKKLDDAQRLLARVSRDPNQPFEGSLKSQKRDELLDIAYAIGLKDMDKRVMADIRDTIINYFDKHPRLRDSPVYSPLFNPSHRSGAQQTAAIPTPSASQQPAIADSSRQPLGNISHSSLTNIALSHPCFAVPHTSPPHLQLQPPLQSNLQYNNFNSTISHPLNLHYTQYPSYLP